MKKPIVFKPDYRMYNAVTTAFKKEMIKQLAENFEKGDRHGLFGNGRKFRDGWLTFDKKGIMNELYYHTGKLQAALMANDKELIKEFSADIANLAMMCFDTFGEPLI